MKPREELAKWLMDIGKYIATAVLISSLLGDMKSQWMVYTFGVISVLGCLFGGLLIIKTLNKK